MARNPEGTGPTTANLTTEQVAEVNSLKEELKYYQSLLTKTKSKRSKIKNILDNFEKVVVGDMILDIIPDENSEEIMNSVIISKSDIINKLDNTDTGNSYSSYVYDTIYRAKSLVNTIFTKNVIKELIARSTQLNEEELYLPIYYQMIEQSNSSVAAKDLVRNVLEEIETDLL